MVISHDLRKLNRENFVTINFISTTIFVWKIHQKNVLKFTLRYIPKYSKIVVKITDRKWSKYSLSATKISNRDEKIDKSKLVTFFPPLQFSSQPFLKVKVNPWPSRSSKLDWFEFLIAEHVTGQRRDGGGVPSGNRVERINGGDERRRSSLVVAEFAILEATFGRGRGTWGQRGRHRARFDLVLEPGPCSRPATS